MVRQVMYWVMILMWTPTAAFFLIYEPFFDDARTTSWRQAIGLFALILALRGFGGVLLMRNERRRADAMAMYRRRTAQPEKPVVNPEFAFDDNPPPSRS